MCTTTTQKRLNNPQDLGAVQSCPIVESNFTLQEKDVLKIDVLKIDGEVVDKRTGEILSYKPDLREINHLAKKEIQRLSISKRVRECSTFAVPSKSVEIKQKLSINPKTQKEQERLYLANLNKCCNVWACPSCASKIRKGKQDEIKKAMERHLENGGVLLVGVHTIEHFLSEPLNVVLGALQKAERLFADGKAGKRLRARNGIVGQIKALECTFSFQNGWHPHYHLVYFVEGGSYDLPDLFERWRLSAEKLGRNAVGWANGFEEINSFEGVAAYLSKNQIGINFSDRIEKAANETTAFSIKNEGKGSTPFQLALMGEKALFNEFEKAFKGKRAISFSRGLFKTLGIEKDKRTDEQIVLETESGNVLRTLTPIEFEALKFYDFLYHILRLGEKSLEMNGNLDLMNFKISELVEKRRISVQKE